MIDSNRKNKIVEVKLDNLLFFIDTCKIKYFKEKHFTYKPKQKMCDRERERECEREREREGERDDFNNLYGTCSPLYILVQTLISDAYIKCSQHNKKKEFYNLDKGLIVGQNLPVIKSGVHGKLCVNFLLLDRSRNGPGFHGQTTNDSSSL